MIRGESRNRGRLASGLALVLLAHVAVTTACRQASSEQKPLTPVRVSQVQTVDTGTSNTYSANIQPYQQVDLAFKSNGYLASIKQTRDENGKLRNIDQGDWVTKGTVLAVVEQDDYKEKLQQAKAQLDRAKANADRAKLQFDRMSVLYQAGAATKPDYDRANADMLDTQAAIQSATSSVSEAQIALGYCELRVPFDGFIVKRNVDVGQLVGPATNGFSIADVHSVKAVFGVPDTAMSRIRLGSPEVITTDAVPGNFNGHVTSISPAADPKSRVYSVEVSIPNSDNRLKAGMIASISISAGELRKRVNVVPLTAVVRSLDDPNGFAVFLLEGNGDTVTARLHDVQVGATYGNLIAVESGLSPGDRVVTTGATMIKNGEQVRVIP
ncbi:MAG TPA: efflux RND transporter periplasmic adaptor subunit [Bryocella sp.]|nr:efflux RND transporter periplasmic adaptor subunit [Bryocella sp.]